MKNKEYWKQLNDEYTAHLNKNASDQEILDWYKKDRKQNSELIDKYGEISWILNDFANALRVEKISESFFRKLCRYILHKNFENETL